MKIGKQSAVLKNVYLGETAVVTGPKEKNGPLGRHFDKTYDKLHCNAKSWEKAEMQLLRDAIEICLEKNGLEESDVDYFIGGDLNNQLVIGNYVLRSINCPISGFSEPAAPPTKASSSALPCSRQNSEEKFWSALPHTTPLPSVNSAIRPNTGQKPESLTFTVTAAGVALLQDEPTPSKFRIHCREGD